MATFNERALVLAMQDYCDTCYVEGYKTVADKHWLSAKEFELYVKKHAGDSFFEKWERYNHDHKNPAPFLKYNSAGVITYVRPSWYTGALNCKFIPRHHILWCIYHEVTEVPKGYVVYHPQRNYNNAPPHEYVCVTRSEHQTLVNAQRREKANDARTV